MTAANSNDHVFSPLRGLRNFRQTFVLFLALSIATGCGGGSTTTTPPPPPASSEFVFLAEVNSAPAIHSYKLDISTGDLTEVGTPAPSIWASPLITDPNGRFLYTAPVKTNIDGVWAYSINSSTGQLLQVPGSPYTNVPLTSKGSLLVEPSGKFLYYNQVAFSIDQNSGALTLLQNVTLPSAVYAITKDDLWIEFSCPGADATVSSYKIDLTTGGLAPLANFVFPCLSPGYIPVVDPSGRFIYVGGAIIQLDAKTGAMSQTGSTLAYEFVFDPVEHFAYGADGTGNVDGFAMDPNTGALSQLQGFPMQLAGAAEGNFGIDPSGKFLVTITGATYEIDPTSGSLTPKSGQVLTDSTAVAFYPPGAPTPQGF